jgi:hypothetical protein
MMLLYQLFLIGLILFFISLMNRDVIEFKSEQFVTNPPPVLPRDNIPWAGTYSMLSKDIDTRAHSPLLINYWPMLKPPKDIEKIATGEEIDIARPQFIPKMAKRS